MYCSARLARTKIRTPTSCDHPVGSSSTAGAAAVPHARLRYAFADAEPALSVGKRVYRHSTHTKRRQTLQPTPEAPLASVNGQGLHSMSWTCAADTFRPCPQRSYVLRTGPERHHGSRRLLGGRRLVLLRERLVDGVFELLLGLAVGGPVTGLHCGVGILHRLRGIGER